MESKHKKIGGAIALCLVTCCVTIFVMNFLASNGIFIGVGGEVAQKYKMLNAAREIVESTYYKDVDSVDLMDGAIKGMVESLEDPYSAYFTSDEYQSYSEHLNGSFSGIGVSAVYDQEKGMLRIVRLYAQSPAEKGGMQVGDFIAKVDGSDVVGKDSTSTIAMIRGDEGTQVTVTVLRDEKLVDLTLQRGIVQVEQVDWEMLDDQIAYVRIYEFIGNCTQEFKTALQELQQQGAKGMILDLRDNGGGYVDSAVAICDALLPEGTVVSTKDRAGNEQKMTSDANMAEIPMVVLVNEATASASEITAGALQDYGRAKIVGMQTYGKGVVQSIRKLGDGGLKLTIAEYYTPNGRNLNGEGLMPDVEIDLPLELKNSPSKITEQNDTQLQKALELLSQEVATNQ